MCWHKAEHRLKTALAITGGAEMGSAISETCPGLWPKNHIFVEKCGLPLVQNLNKKQTLPSTRHNKAQAEIHRPWEGNILSA